MLTQKRLKELLHYDPETGVWTWVVKRSNWAKIGSKVGCLNHDGYLHIKIDNKAYKSSRLAWFYFFGKWPDNIMDHINRIRTDDRITNLRDVSFKENAKNTGHNSGRWGVRRRKYPPRKAREPSSYQPGDGVYYRKDRNQWRARTYVNRVRVHIGNFQTFEEATSAYNRFVGRS